MRVLRHHQRRAVGGDLETAGAAAHRALRHADAASCAALAAAGSDARLPVPHEDRHGHPPRRRQRGDAAPAAAPDSRAASHALLVDALLLLGALSLVAVVLEPNLDLRGRQSDDGRQVLALGGGQVALLAEASLKLVGLRLAEEDAPFALLLLLLLLARALGAAVVLRTAVVATCNTHGGKISIKNTPFNLNRETA